MDEFQPPDGGWGWVVVFASACVQGLILGQIKSFGLILLEIIDKLDTSYAFAQWIIGLACTLAFGLGKCYCLFCLLNCLLNLTIFVTIWTRRHKPS